MQFNPKIGFYLGILVTIEIAVSGGTLGLTNAFPAAWIPHIIAWSGILAFMGSTVLTFLHGFSSGETGPLVKLPPEVGKVAALLLLVAGALVLGSSAHAAEQVTRQPIARPAGLPLPAPIFCDPFKLIPGCQQQQLEDGEDLSPAIVWKRITDVATPDLKFAKGLADTAMVENPTGGAKQRSQCYAAVIALNEQTSGANLPKNADGTPATMPNPHVISTVEMAAEIVDDLGPNSPVMSGCAAAAQAAKLNTLNFVNALVTGATSLVAVGVK